MDILFCTAVLALRKANSVQMLQPLILPVRPPFKVCLLLCDTLQMSSETGARVPSGGHIRTCTMTAYSIRGTNTVFKGTW